MSNEVVKTQIMTEQQFNESPLKNVMSYQDYFINALKSGSAFNFGKSQFTLKNNNNLFGFGFATNPYKTEQKTLKEELYEKIANVKDPAIRQQILDGLSGANTPSKMFVDMLIKRYEKKQAQFEQAWAEYQASKDNLAFYKKVMETLEKKYANSESDYENGLVSKAEKNYKNSEMYSDILLSKASDIAHRLA